MVLGSPEWISDGRYRQNVRFRASKSFTEMPSGFGMPFMCGTIINAGVGLNLMNSRKLFDPENRACQSEKRPDPRFIARRWSEARGKHSLTGFDCLGQNDGSSPATLRDRLRQSHPALINH
jgi:hypothetical protein